MNLPRIAFIGFRATGKSQVGGILAKRIGWEFLDMDERLVANLGMDIQTWVLASGWESFRETESKLLEELTVMDKIVVATGGGVILSPANRKRLRENFLVVWLQASSETIAERISQDPKTISQRPALTELPLREEINSLLLQRFPLYEECADIVLSTEKASPDALALEIESLIKAKGFAQS
ncbi:MAG: shikimate kinase [Syntrophobacteraceae bacterium]